MKFASLVSQTTPLRLHTRMRPRLVAGPVTFQVCSPSLEVFDCTGCQLIPPSREIPIFTFPLKPLEAHLMVTFLLMYHASPAFGVWTVICAPVPLTPREALPPFDVKLTFPVKLPVAVGLKRTTTPRLPPVWRLNGLPEKTPKGEDAEALPVRVPPPMFRTVKNNRDRGSGLQAWETDSAAAGEHSGFCVV